MGESVVDRLRLVNPYSVSQMLAVCREAADEIERLRAAGDELAEHLSNWAYSTEHALSEHRALETWEEVRRD